jgi:hypothetical protein
MQHNPATAPPEEPANEIELTDADLIVGDDATDEIADEYLLSEADLEELRVEMSNPPVPRLPGGGPPRAAPPGDAFVTLSAGRALDEG